ncbi:MAG: hypothetical protein HQL50_05635 [Magnetococcales bacterium]|nr:hypothetical protein [Magnetococcales bacterium]
MRPRRGLRQLHRFAEVENDPWAMGFYYALLFLGMPPLRITIPRKPLAFLLTACHITQELESIA